MRNVRTTYADYSGRLDNQAYDNGFKTQWR